MDSYYTEEEDWITFNIYQKMRQQLFLKIQNMREDAPRCRPLAWEHINNFLDFPFIKKRILNAAAQMYRLYKRDCDLPQLGEEGDNGPGDWYREILFEHLPFRLVELFALSQLPLHATRRENIYI